MLAGQLGSWSTGRGALQQKLARALMQVIRAGTIPPGLRLPSERALAQALTVSRTTVVAAYDALREENWLESRPGSGTWSRRTPPPPRHSASSGTGNLWARASDSCGQGVRTVTSSRPQDL